jgi:hypothetical protein
MLDLTGVQVTVVEEADVMLMVCPAVSVSAFYIDLALKQQCA